MDLSLEYIKMCEKLPTEMLERRIEDDDYIIVIDRELTLYKGLAGLHKDPFLSPVPVRIIRLFKQDQLQEMMDWNDFQLTAAFSKFVHSEAGYVPTRFTSMEQLWLAFVMKEKYSKTWNGSKWIFTPDDVTDEEIIAAVDMLDNVPVPGKGRQCWDGEKIIDIPDVEDS